MELLSIVSPAMEKSAREFFKGYNYCTLDLSLMIVDKYREEINDGVDTKKCNDGVDIRSCSSTLKIRDNDGVDTKDKSVLPLLR